MMRREQRGDDLSDRGAAVAAGLNRADEFVDRSFDEGNVVVIDGFDPKIGLDADVIDRLL
jgi:hypothetical protein